MCGWKDYITVYVSDWESVGAVHDCNQSWDLDKTVVA
jgi:hypothetical protein